MSSLQQHFQYYALVFATVLAVVSCTPDADLESHEEPTISVDEKIDSLKNLLDALPITLDSTTALERATWFHEIGKELYYNYENRYKEALINADSAIFYRGKYLGNDTLTYRSIILRATIFQQQGQHYSAIELVDLVINNIELAQKGGILTQYEADSLITKYNNQLVDNYLYLNIPHAALNYIESDTDYRIGIAYEQMGKADEAIDFFKAYIEHLKTNKVSFFPEDKQSYYDLLTTSYNSIALAYQAKEKFTTAIRYFDKSITAFKEGGLENNIYYAETLINKGLVEGLQYKYAKAKQTLRIAENILVNENFGYTNPLYSELYLNKGNLVLWQGETNQALKLFQEAAQVVVPDFKPKNSKDLPKIERSGILSKNLLISILESKAKAWQKNHEKSSKIGNLEQALSTYQTLDLLINQLRTDYQMDASKFWLLEKTRAIYEQAISTCFSLHVHTGKSKYLKQALQYAVRNKAIIMRENQRDEYAKDVAGIPDNIRKREQQLSEAIYNLEVLYSEAVKKDSLSDIQEYAKQLVQKRNDQGDLIDSLEQVFPKYYALKYAPLDTIQVDSIQQQLGVDEGLIEYFLGKDTLYTFVITKDDIKHYSTVRPDSLTSTIEQLQKEVEYPHDIKHYNRLAHQLYTWVLKTPLEPLLERNINRLTIVPDDVLMRIPYDALQMQEKDETEVSNYVIDKCTLSYLYSSQFFVSQTDIILPKKPSFLGIGISFQNQQYLYWLNTQLIQVKGKSGVSELPSAAEEVKLITCMLDGILLIDSMATRKTFIDSCSSFSIFHLATHGYLDTEYPLNSALLFTVSDTMGQHIDSVLLTIADIYQLDSLRADMVVLSACNTAAGELQTGEGLQTLARAFQYAGAKSLVASLWSASDKVSKDIMIFFYENLQKGMSKDEALRQAKMKYFNDSTLSPHHSHPANWATFILIGDRTPIFVD